MSKDVEREMFEAAYAEELCSRGTPPTFAAFLTEPGGEYTLPIVERAWAMWKRGRAALASAPATDTWTTGDDDLDMALNMAGVPGDGALAQVEAVERLKARLASAPVAGEVSDER